MNKNKNLNSSTIFFVTDHGDTSVGLNLYFWEIESPFLGSEQYTETDLFDFAEGLKQLYEPFCNGKCTVEW